MGASAASEADIGAMHIEDSMKVAMKGHLGQGVTPSLLKNSLPLAVCYRKISPHRIATPWRHPSTPVAKLATRVREGDQGNEMNSR